MSLGTTYSSEVPLGGAASYKLWPVFTYSNGYWEVYRRFQGNFFWSEGGSWVEGLRGRKFHMEEILMGEDTFNGGGRRIFLHHLKKQWKIKHEKFFSAESEKQH